MKTIIFFEGKEIGSISEQDFPVYLDATIRMDEKKYFVVDIEFKLIPQGKHISWEKHVYLERELTAEEKARDEYGEVRQK